MAIARDGREPPTIVGKFMLARLLSVISVSQPTRFASARTSLDEISERLEDGFNPHSLLRFLVPSLLGDLSGH